MFFEYKYILYSNMRITFQITSLFAIFAICVLLVFKIPAYTSGRNLLATSLLVFFFITSTTTATYCLEKKFRQASLGQMAILLLSIVSGIFTVFIILLLTGLYANQVKSNCSLLLNLSSNELHGYSFRLPKM